jgi:hypothetical protein
LIGINLSIRPTQGLFSGGDLYFAISLAVVIVARVLCGDMGLMLLLVDPFSWGGSKALGSSLEMLVLVHVFLVESRPFGLGCSIDVGVFVGGDTGGSVDTSNENLAAATAFLYLGLEAHHHSHHLDHPHG